MKTKLGVYIQQVDERNINNDDLPLYGLSNEKKFISSIANIIGTDLSKYKIVKKNQFAYCTVTSRNGDKISIALMKDDAAIVSSSYITFKITDSQKLLPEYLDYWFKRKEFDRYARYMSHGSVRETFSWESMCDIEIDIPSISKQKTIVNEFKKLENEYYNLMRININLNTIINDMYLFEFEKNNDYEKLIKLSCLLDIKSGYAFKSDWWVSKGEPVIKIGGIVNNTILLGEQDFVSFENSEKATGCIGYPGDLVIALTGATVGKVGIIPNTYKKMFINQRVGLIKPLDSTLLPFIYASLNSKNVQNAIKSVGGDSAQENVSPDDIKSIKIKFYSNNKMIDFSNKIKPFYDEININSEKMAYIDILLKLLSENIVFDGKE